MATKKISTRKNKKALKRVSKKNQKKRFSLLKFLPAILVTSLASFLLLAPSAINQRGSVDVLSYATNTTRTGLLSATNVQRNNNGVSSLSLNSSLNSAAQSKANDMINRDYWAHETPDGKQPWVFFTGAGYQYLAAGENLAYGYPDSNSTVIGWMNSPPHKSNLISANYTEVGFGIANSTNYVGKGEQTVVVAMYGKPQVASATTSAPQSTPAPAPAPVKKTTISQQPDDTIIKEPKKEMPKEEPIAIANDVETEEVEILAAPTSTSKIQLLTEGNAAWSVTAVILTICSIGLLWVVHRGFHIKKYLVAGEHFVAKHLYLDVFVLSIIFLGFVLLNTTGAIK